ncbi:MAG: alpha/beta hydrolase [Kiloniellales bacterium]|nr:alpha/beta hydrolase [Kiloniellales bacterium]
MRSALSLLGRAALVLSFGGVAFALGAVVMHNLVAPGRPDLQLWHTERLDAEFTLDRAEEIRSFEDYRRLEDELFAQLERQVVARVDTGPANDLVRYSAGSAADPRRRETNWNRSFELSADRPAGGVLLLHGRSDGPYSLRAIGEALNRQGYWVLGLRLPGHGTIPSGLLAASWEDTTAAVRLGMAHLASKVGDGPVHMIGYSTGSALAVEYGLDAMAGVVAPPPASLTLVSPAIGISPLATLAKWKARLAALPGLESFAWADVVPEFDPFKYNSFTTNSIVQVRRLTVSLAERVEALAEPGPIEGFPPTLIFLSSVDATVSVDAVVDNLLEHLAPGDHELVLFDINRKSAKSTLLISDPSPLIERLMGNESLPFELVLVTNIDPGTDAVVSRRKATLSTASVTEPLGLSWPLGLISLSHVALPFPPDDPLYGRRAPADGELVFLGQINLQGELGLLLFSSDRLLRLRHNPFYDFLENRTMEWLDETGGRTRTGS